MLFTWEMLLLSTECGLSSNLSCFFVKRIAVDLTPLSRSPLLVHKLSMLLRCRWAIYLTVILHIPLIRITKLSANGWIKLEWVPNKEEKVSRVSSCEKTPPCGLPLVATQ